MELDLLNLLLVLFIAWGAGLVATKVGYPAVLGELLAGIVFGPPLLGLIGGGEALALLAEVGLLLMMLYIGMEIDPAELGRASKGGILAALGGFIAPFVLCYLLIVPVAGYPPLAGVFVGVAAGVTSLATKSRILVDLKLLDTRIAHVMMAGALIADTLALVVFAAVIGVAEAGSFSVANLAEIAGKAVAFFGAAAFFGLYGLPVFMRWLSERIESRTALFTAVVLIMLIYAEAAHLVGMHGILGAFLAGLFLRERVLGRTLSREMMHVVRDTSIGFLAPVFFITAGFAVSLDVFTTDLGLLVGLVGLATAGKVIGTALFYLPTGHGWREGTVLGLGMNGRGAVEIIIAQIGLTMGLITAEVFSVLVFMALATTALVPVTLKWGVEWLRKRGELVRSDEERVGVLVVGAGPAARRLAGALSHSGTTPVTVLDSNAEHVRLAQKEGLTAIRGSGLDERVLSEAGAAHVRHLVAVTPNGEVNTLVAQLGRSVFAVPEIHVLRSSAAAAEQASMNTLLGATTLFGGPAVLGEWAYLAGQDRARTETVKVEADEAADMFARRFRREGALPLTLRRSGETLPFHDGLKLQAGDRVVLLRALAAAEAPHDRFDALIERCPVLDLDGPLVMADFAKSVARAMAPDMDLEEGEVMERMLSREALSSTVILPGLAIPHLRVEGEEIFTVVMARCQEGIDWPGHETPVVAAFALATSDDQRHLHLRALAAIAHVAQQPDFEKRWLQAEDADALRTLVLRTERRREVAVEA